RLAALTGLVIRLMTAPTELVDRYPVLTELPPAVRDAVIPRLQAMQVPAGTVLFDDHQACEGFPFVVRGSIRVIKASASGRELPLYRVAPGETCVISSSCLLGHEDYNARGIAETDTELVLLPKAVFEALLT